MPEARPPEQGAAVRSLLSAAGYADVCTVPDLERRDRVTLGRYNRRQP